MKNKITFFTILAVMIVGLASCGGSRYGYQRKGYGCPATVALDKQTVERSISS